MSKTDFTELDSGPLNVIKYRWIFLGISILLLLPGLVFIVMNMLNPEIKAPVRLGIDFRGGTLLEYGFEKKVSQADLNDIRDVFEKHGYSGSVVQIQEPRVGINKEAVEVGTASKDDTASIDASTAATPAKTEPAATTPATNAPVTADNAAEPKVNQSSATNQTPKLDAPTPITPSADSANAAAENKNIASIVSVRSKHLQGDAHEGILQDLQAKYGHITVLQKNSIGPAMASELLKNGLLALLLAYVLIVGYMTYRFQFDFAVCAMGALVHDTIFVIGMFAIFGDLFHTEIDSLFITAVLTAVGFSVHDTIVVFDRIRENMRVYFTKKIPFDTLTNMSVNQTLARSINTSLTALLPLIALYFWGGETTRDFVLAIILGIAIGTYSSIFNASVLLAMWRSKSSQSAVAAA